MGRIERKRVLKSIVSGRYKTIATSAARLPIRVTGFANTSDGMILFISQPRMKKKPLTKIISMLSGKPNNVKVCPNRLNWKGQKIPMKITPTVWIRTNKIQLIPGMCMRLLNL